MILILFILLSAVTAHYAAGEACTNDEDNLVVGTTPLGDETALLALAPKRIHSHAAGMDTKSSGDCVTQSDYDYGGYDYDQVSRVESAQACARICGTTGACKSWTYGKLANQWYTGTCFLKSAKPAGSVSNCCDSGLPCVSSGAESEVARLESEVARLEGSASKVPGLEDEVARLEDTKKIRGDEILRLQLQVADLKEGANKVPGLESEVASLDAKLESITCLSKCTNYQDGWCPSGSAVDNKADTECADALCEDTVANDAKCCKAFAKCTHYEDGWCPSGAVVDDKIDTECADAVCDDTVANDEKCCKTLTLAKCTHYQDGWCPSGAVVDNKADTECADGVCDDTVANDWKCCQDLKFKGFCRGEDDDHSKTLSRSGRSLESCKEYCLWWTGCTAYAYSSGHVAWGWNDWKCILFYGQTFTYGNTSIYSGQYADYDCYPTRW